MGLENSIKVLEVMPWPRTLRDNRDKSHRAIQIPSACCGLKWIACSIALWAACRHSLACSLRVGTQGFALMPSLDVKETAKEIAVEAELPGLDEKDVSLTIQNGVLTIKGEKKFEHEEQKENYHVMERRYGSFQRSLRIPDTVDEERIEARFDKGVLKVTLPKRAESVSEQRKIEIKKS